MTDTMVVDACLGGVRIARPAGATLDLNFMSAPLDPRITFARASTATYTDASGTIRSAAINAPRWDYTGGSLRGLLIEETRANLLWPSVLPGGANWATGGTATTTANAAVAPDGTTTAALLAATSTANDIRSVINGVVTGTSGTTYTVSAFVKTSGGANMYYQINAGGAAAAYFDLTAGTGLVGADLVAGITNKSVSIIPFPNGWYRVSFTLAPSATGTLGVYIGLCAAVSASGDNRSSVGVVGQGIYVWGVQVEQGSFGPTSHIPTTAAAVTRAVDGPSIAQANMGWFVAGPGSWFAEFIHQTTPTSNAPRIIGYPSAGGKTPLFVSATAQAAAFDGNAVVASVNTLTRGAVSKAVSAWAPSTGKVCLNGGAVASGSETTGFLDAATTGIVLFQTGIPLESSTGYLRRVQYWPRALSDTEMQQVTT